MKKLVQDKRFVWVGALISCFLWASLFSFIKIGYEIMDISEENVPGQILFAGYVFLIAGILGVVGGGLSTHTMMFRNDESSQESRSAFRCLKSIVIIGLLQTVAQYTFLYVGLAHTSAAKGSIISSTNVFISIILSSLIFKQESLSCKKITGCLLGFVGIILINAAGESFEVINLFGDGFVLLSAFSVGLAVVLVKNVSADIEPVMLSGWQSLFGGIMLIAVGYVTGGYRANVNISFWLVVIYISSASAIAYAIWCILLKYHPVSVVTMYGMTEPIFGVILSAVLLGENILKIQYVIALVLVSGGICLVNQEDEI